MSYLLHSERREAFCSGRACVSCFVDVTACAGRAPGGEGRRANFLLAVEFHDQLLVHRQVHVLALRQRQYLAGEILVIDSKPLRGLLVARKLGRAFEHRHLLRALADLDLIDHLNLIGGDVYLSSIHFDVAVAHDLARLATAGSKAKTIGHVVEATLELLQQDLARDARRAVRLLVVLAELALQREVDALRLLLFTQLQTVADDLHLAIAAMLAGGEVALVHRTLLGVALGALQKKLHAFATAKATDCSGITCHLCSPQLQVSTGLQARKSDSGYPSSQSCFS